MRKALVGLLLFAFGSVSLLGQNTFGSITGVVTDATGAVATGVTITITNPETNLTRTALTNDTGNYNFPAVQPGTYSVKAELSGFQTELRSGVTLQVQQVARIDFKMTVGAMTQTVEVSGGAPLVNTENASLGTVIENQRIVDLPLNGRDFLQLVALSPNVSASFNVNGGAANGAATTRLGGQRANQSFSVSGTRKEFNNYTLDGLSNTEVNYNAYIFLPSVDALQEFKVQTGIYSAEFGRGVGQITASTKSGTNEYHGVLFEFLRNNVFDARPYAFTNVVPASAPFRQNTFGGTLGGPLSIPKVFSGKDRLFFMSSYEGRRERQQTQQVFTTATQAMRDGDFSGLTGGLRILDPASGSSPAARIPFVNNQIPLNRLHPISVALLQYFPLPNVAGAGIINNYLGLQSNVFDKDQFTQRIDFAESTHSTWFGRYSWGADSQVNPSLYLNGSTLNVHATQAMIANTRILSPTLVNDARFGFDWFQNSAYYETTNNPAFNIVEKLGLQLGSSWSPLDYGIPQIGINGQSAFGTPTEGPYDFRDVTFQWNDGLSWIHGKHSFKFGVDIRRDRFNTAGNAFSRGSYTFGNQATGGIAGYGYGFADFILGYLSSDLKSISGNVAQMRATSQAYYVTDSWKIRPNLTIDAGLRYEYTPPWGYRNDTEANWDIPYIAYTPADAIGKPHPTIVRVGQGDFYAGINGVFNPAIQVARDGRLGDRLMKSDFKNFAPRLGFAWSPASKWSVHAGGGFFYAQDIGQAYYDITRNLSGRISPAANPTTNDLTWNDPYFLNGTNPCNTVAPKVCISTPGPLAAQVDRRTPYVIQWTASVERQLSGTTVLEFDYLGSVSHFLQRFHGLNNPVPGTGNVAARRPWPEIGGIQYVDGDVDANYEAGTVKLTRRLSAGLSLLSALTYSKAIDTGSGIRANTNDSGLQNSACVNPCERGLSQFDQRFRFVTSALYELPVGKGRQFMNHGGVTNVVLGGWRLSSIVTLGSGFPNGVSTGIARSGAGGDRPDAVPGQAVKLDNPTTNQWFNIRAFVANQPNQFGNVGRNVVIGPGIRTWDFSMLKDFNFTERKFLQFRFECFNCANHPNFGEPNTTLGANGVDSQGYALPGTAFGTIRSLRSGLPNRQMQFALKLVF